MGKDEEIEWDVFETVIAWFAAIQDDQDANPDDVDDFLRRLGVAVTNPTFHMKIAEEAGELNYGKLEGLLPGDIEAIKQAMKSYTWISKGPLYAEVRKYINYLEKYNSKIRAGGTEDLKGMEKTIREVAEEYTIIINDLKLY